MRRVTITIPPEVLEAAEAQASREKISVSAFLSRAAAHAVTLAQGRAAAAEVFDEIGWPTPEERAETDRVLDRAVARQAVARRAAADAPSADVA